MSDSQGAEMEDPDGGAILGIIVFYAAAAQSWN